MDLISCFKILIIYNNMSDDISGVSTDNIHNLQVDVEKSRGLPNGVTCMGWGCCVNCNGGLYNNGRGTKYCSKLTCWKIVSTAKILKINDNKTLKIRFNRGYIVKDNVDTAEVKHAESGKKEDVYKVNDTVYARFNGCNKIATKFCSRNEKYKWTVCDFCSDRGLYALNEVSSYLGYRYDLATNKKL